MEMNTIIDYIRGNQNYFENFVTRNTYHSNAIEGSTLSYANTYAILFNDNSMTVSGSPREIYEAINHKYALSLIMDRATTGEELSERLIKDIAIQINKNIEEISGYRTVSVYIRGAEHVPPSPAELLQKMMYFVYNYNHTEYKNLYEKIAVNHIDFERLHPFQDGNGRTGRLMMNFELLRNNMPPIIIPKEQRTTYFDYLVQRDSSGLAAFVESLVAFEHENMMKF